MEAAWGGVLIIVTMPFSCHAYMRLLDLLQSAEDWEIRPRLDAMLYAVVQPATQLPGETAVEADVFVPVARR